jgi:hypothetical protein
MVMQPGYHQQLFDVHLAQMIRCWSKDTTTAEIKTDTAASFPVKAPSVLPGSLSRSKISAGSDFSEGIV